jgi:hypothetical protein
MAYTIQAFIADAKTFAGNVSDAALRPLYGSLVIFPLVHEVRKSMGIATLPFTDDDFAELSAIADAGENFSKAGKVVYVEAEFFGGTGNQASCMFELGKMVGEVEIHHDAINRALRFLGVELKSAIDEFEMVGLGRVRSTEGWLGAEDEVDP